jgi:hypothetical protein
VSCITHAFLEFGPLKISWVSFLKRRELDPHLHDSKWLSEKRTRRRKEEGT